MEVSSLFLASSLLVCYRISEATLGSFSAPFRGFFVLHCHGVWGWRIPRFGGLEGGSFELISSLVCYRISEATLGSFSTPFRGFFVLHCHGVWGWRIPCFGGLEGGSFELISSFVCYIELISSLVFVASSSFTAMVFEAGGSRVYVFWRPGRWKFWAYWAFQKPR